MSVGQDSADHGHSHGHHAHDAVPRAVAVKEDTIDWSPKEKKLIQVICIASFFMVVEIIGGYYANSIAIFSDALHMFADSAGFAISLAAAGYARMRPNKDYTFGYYRAEILGALGSLLLIWVLTIFLVIEAFNRIETIVTGGTVTVDGRIMTIIACAGIFSNIIMLTVFSDEHHDSFSLAHSHEHGHCSGHAHVETTHEEEESGCGGHDHGHGHAHAEPEPDLRDHGHGHGHGHAAEPDEETPLASAGDDEAVGLPRIGQGAPATADSRRRQLRGPPAQ